MKMRLKLRSTDIMDSAHTYHGRETRSANDRSKTFAKVMPDRSAPFI